MNYCTMDNGNCKTNKYALNMQLHKTKEISLELFISLAEQSLKQTNVKGWKPKFERIQKVWVGTDIKTCSSAVWISSYWKWKRFYEGMAD